MASVLGPEDEAPLHVTAVQGVTVGQPCRAMVARSIPPAQGLAEGLPARKDGGRHQVLGVQRHDAQAVRVIDSRAVRCIVRLTACFSALGVTIVVRASGHPGACPGMGACTLVLLFFLLAPFGGGRLFTPFGRYLGTPSLGQGDLAGGARTGAAGGVIGRTGHQNRQQGRGKQQGGEGAAHGWFQGGDEDGAKEAGGQGEVDSGDGRGCGCGAAHSARRSKPLHVACWLRLRASARDDAIIGGGSRFGRTASSTMARWTACRHIIASWIR